MDFISRIILKIMGWKVVGTFPPEIKKCILIAAPHTSMWDFILGRLAFYRFGIKVKFLIKVELFRFPFGGLLKSLGGIPVNRGKKNNMVDYVAEQLINSEKLIIVITPEGTRKYNAHWKKGFYHIALRANVPLVMAFIDYKKKEGGVGGILYPSGNFEEDFKTIEDFYSGCNAKYPEKYNLSEMYKDKHKKIV